MVTVGSSRPPNVLESIFSPGLNRFWRKTDADTHSRQVFDSNISAIYGDLFDGKTETATVSGGVENMFYLSDFPMAQKPSFGDAKLVGAKLFFYVNEIDRNEIGSVGRVPQYNFFLSSHNIGKGNEGDIKAYPSREEGNIFPDSPIAVFTSNFSNEGFWLQENFSGGGESIVVNGTVQIKTGAYLPFDWAQQNNNDWAYFQGDWDRYASTLPNGDKVIYVEKTGWGKEGGIANTLGWDQQWTPVNGRRWWKDDPEWRLGNTTTGGKAEMMGSGYPLYAYETESTTTVNPPANTENTFFDEIKIMNTDTVLGESGDLAHGSEIAFASGDGNKGGAALKMQSVWSVDKSGSLPWSTISTAAGCDLTGVGESNGREIGGKYIREDGNTYQSNNLLFVPCRQRAVITKKIPTPIIYKTDKGMDYTGVHGKSFRANSPEDTPLENIYPDKGDTLDKDITTSEIQIDMKIDSLTRAPYFLDHEDTWNNPKDDGFEFTSMDGRNVAVTMGTRPPRDGECFFDYYYNTRNDGEGWKDSQTTSTTGKGAFKDRDGMMTGFVIVRPQFTDYMVDRLSIDGDILNPGDDSSSNKYILGAVSENKPGKSYTQAAEKWPDSQLPYTFKKDGLTLIPFVNNTELPSYTVVEDTPTDACNWINGAGYVDSSGQGLGTRGAWNYWSIMGGLKREDGTGGKDTWGGGGKGVSKSAYTNSQHLIFARAAFNANAIQNYCVPFPDKEWIRVRIFLNGEVDKIYFQIEDMGGKIIGRTHCEYNNNVSLWSNPPIYLSIWANNMPGSINTDAAGKTARRWHGESTSEAFETRTTLLIDNVTLKNFNMQHKNATVTNLNKEKRKIELNKNTVTNAYLQDTITPTYISFGFENASDIMDDPTYLLFNTLSGKTAAPTAIGNNYIRATASMEGWWGNEDLGHEEELGMGRFESGPLAYGTAQHNLFYTRTPFFHMSDGMYGGYGQLPGRGLSINNSETGGAGLFWDGTPRAGGLADGSAYGISMSGNETDIENFSFKGLMKINHNNFTEMDVTTSGYGGGRFIHKYTIVRRENQWASARITDFSLADNTITVDDPTIFNLKAGIPYRMYVRGQTKGGNYQTVYLSDDNISSQEIKLKTSMSAWLFRSDGHIDNLWISPLLHWLVFEILPFDSSNEPVEDRLYSSVVEVNRTRTAFPSSTDYGVTFNEFAYNDGVYQNAWDMDISSGASDIITDVDFGFGSYDTETLKGGELSKVKLVDQTLWHVADFSPLVKESKKAEGDIVTTLMVPHAEDSFTKSIIQTTESTAKIAASEEGYFRGGGSYEGVHRPFLLTTFEDELPTIADFEIQPDEVRPSLPKFTWSCKDDDVWYGFIIVSDEQILNQYHKSLIHLPLNTPKKTNKSIDIDPGQLDTSIPDWYSHLHNLNSTTLGDSFGVPYTYPIYYDLEDSELAFDPEGLAGWCHRFTQPTGGEALWMINWFSKNESLNVLPTYDSLPKKEMSLIMHIIPDYHTFPLGTQQTIFDNGGGVVPGDTLQFFKVYIDVNGYLNVEICPDNCHEDGSQNTIIGTNAKVTLTSKTIVPMDGETPTNIIVTLDAGLKRNNVKLFINGKLEDTTGRSYLNTLQSSSDRWPFDTKMATETTLNYMSLGNNVSLRTPTSQLEPYKGRMEEVVYYPICIYPVDVDSGEFILEKPFRELSADNKSKSYSARLFVKDYHNIRGTTSREVASSPSVSWRKSVPLFTEASE